MPLHHQTLISWTNQMNYGIPAASEQNSTLQIIILWRLNHQPVTSTWQLTCRQLSLSMQMAMMVQFPGLEHRTCMPLLRKSITAILLGRHGLSTIQVHFCLVNYLNGWQQLMNSAAKTLTSFCISNWHHRTSRIGQIIGHIDNLTRQQGNMSTNLMSGDWAWSQTVCNTVYFHYSLSTG